MLKMAFDMNRADITAVDGAILSSVVPAVTLTMRDAVHKYLHLTPFVVGPASKPACASTSIIPPSSAATSSWTPSRHPSLSPPADHHRYGYRHHRLRSGCGGRIPRRHDSAGCGRLARCLASRTAQLPKVAFELPKHTIGTNSVDCLKSGLLYGNAGALDGLIDRINAELNTPCTVVATGGLSSVIAPLCRNKIILDDDLLLKGLSILFRKKQPKN